jgi:DNA-directed RNA polymerase subunit M/transcription elongation factor TFIIS
MSTTFSIVIYEDKYRIHRSERTENRETTRVYPERFSLFHKADDFMCTVYEDGAEIKVQSFCPDCGNWINWEEVSESENGFSAEYWFGRCDTCGYWQKVDSLDELLESKPEVETDLSVESFNKFMRGY